MNQYVLLLSGPPATGKTTIAIELWRSLPGRPAHICLDNLKDVFRPPNSSRDDLDLAARNGLTIMRNILALGYSVIVTKAFGRYKYVAPFLQEADRHEARVVYIKLTAGLQTLLRRNEQRREYGIGELIREHRWRPYRATDAQIEEQYRYSFANRHEAGIEVDTGDRSVRESVAIVRQHLFSA